MDPNKCAKFSDMASSQSENSLQNSRALHIFSFSKIEFAITFEEIDKSSYLALKIM